MEAGWVSGCRGAEDVGARVGLGKWGLEPSDERDGFRRGRNSDTVLDSGWGVGSGVDAV